MTPVTATGGRSAARRPGERATPMRSGGAGPGAALLRVGFVALADAAPLVVAVEEGMYLRRGIGVRLVKQASWPALRDAVLSGALDAAHCLSSLPFSVASGITGHEDQLLPIAMMLNTGGQAITLGRHLGTSGYLDPAESLSAVAAESRRRRLTMAMTYPGGTHDLWLRYWLHAAGVDSGDLDIIPIPPAQMVANLRGGTMHGFSVGEPWNAVAVDEGLGFTAVSSHRLFPGHPEKALVVNPHVLDEHPDRVRALIGGTLQACRWLDEDPGHREAAAHLMAARRYVNVAAPTLAARMWGLHERGHGLPPEMGGLAFHGGGVVNAPRRAYGHWFLSQFRRLGLHAGTADPADLVDRLTLRDLYTEVAAAEGVAVPDDDMAPITVAIDDGVFDPVAVRGV